MFNIFSDIEMNSIISVENLSASYGDIKCLFDVNLKVDTGSICALLGPSGCGKTHSFLVCLEGSEWIPAIFK